MDTHSVKKSVVDSYGKLAKSTQLGFIGKLFGCCDISTTAQKVGENIGYSQEELSAVPAGANLGVGCGNPSSLAGIKEGETVVDLGSGAGFDTFIVSPLVGEKGKVIGVDLSDEMLSLAKKNAKKGDYQNVEFIKGDIEQLPLANEQADHIISNCVINLSLNKGEVFKEAYRVLKKGGRLAISDIVLEKELPSYVADSLMGHIICVAGAEKLSDYVTYVEEAGFRDVKIVSEKEFPLEIMLHDPQIINIAKEMDISLDSDQAKDIASRVKSIYLTARK